MNKERLRKLEYPILYSYLGFWLLVYILSRACLEMSTDHTPSNLWILLFIIFIPLGGYTALRMAYSEGGKWYHSIGYFVMCVLGGIFSGDYIVLNGDILISAVIKTPVQAEAEVISVKKVFRRKLGFDHTDVTLNLGGKQITLEARSYSYFYLHDKTSLQVHSGTSILGNTYVTSTGVASSEKLAARWVHLKDWAYRYRLLWIVIACMVLAGLIKVKYFPDKPGVKPKQISFWKFLLILMGSLMAIGLLLYAGLWIYISFFR